MLLFIFLLFGSETTYLKLGYTRYSFKSTIVINGMRLSQFCLISFIFLHPYLEFGGHFEGKQFVTLICTDLIHVFEQLNSRIKVV